MRFHTAPASESGALANITLGEYFTRIDFAPRLLTDYLAPIGAAIWSAPSEDGQSRSSARNHLQRTQDVTDNHSAVAIVCVVAVRNDQDPCRDSLGSAAAVAQGNKTYSAPQRKRHRNRLGDPPRLGL
jgi:predicted NAD/FAD-binding protein